MTYIPSIQPPIKWLLIRPTQGALLTLGAVSLLLVVVLMAWTILIRISISYLSNFSQTEEIKDNNLNIEKLTTHIKVAMDKYKANEIMIGAVGSR